MRLPNVKTLLCWPSRIQIYGFVENHTFLEQFVSMGVPAQFSNLGYQHNFPIWGYQHTFRYFGNDSLEPFESIFIGSTVLAMAFILIPYYDLKSLMH